MPIRFAHADVFARLVGLHFHEAPESAATRRLRQHSDCDQATADNQEPGEQFTAPAGCAA